MKNISKCIFTCLFVSANIAFPCFGSEAIKTTEKIYVTPGSIYVAPDAIYANIDGQFISVPSVSVDSDGVFIESFQFATVCARCGQTMNRGHRCPDKK